MGEDHIDRGMHRANKHTFTFQLVFVYTWYVIEFLGSLLHSVHIYLPRICQHALHRVYSYIRPVSCVQQCLTIKLPMVYEPRLRTVRRWRRV